MSASVAGTSKMSVPAVSSSAPAPGVATPAYKTKDGLIRLLLQGPGNSGSSPQVVSTVSVQSGVMAPPKTTAPAAPKTAPSVTITDENPIRFIHQISKMERECGTVALDHNYQRSMNWRPDGIITWPTKTLFVHRFIRSQAAQIARDQRDAEKPIDVEHVEESAMQLPYLESPANKLLKECETFCDFANPDALDVDRMSDWEEHVVKDGWLPSQNALFMKVVQVLNNDRLARLAVKASPNEAIQVRIVVDKTAKRIRKLLGGILWDTKTTQWLHNVLTDVLPRPYLMAYLDALQTLRQKVNKALIDKMISAKVLHQQQLGIVRNEGVRLLLKRAWDPSIYSTAEPAKFKLLPYDATLILTPSQPAGKLPLRATKRTQHWRAMWGQLFKYVIEMSPPNLDADEPAEEEENSEQNDVVPKEMKMSTYLYKLIKSLLLKIQELKAAHPSRPLILAGWGVAAAINCQVASMDLDPQGNLVYNGPAVHNPNLAACINLGFPYQTLEGSRGEPDDPLLDIRTPLLFAVGQDSILGRRDDIEDLRERIKTSTGLVVVGGADDRLRMSKKKKRAEGVTQAVVDRCVMEEVRSFLVGVLSSPPPNMGVHPGLNLDSTRHLLGFGPGVIRPGSGTKQRTNRPRKRVNSFGEKPAKKSRSSGGAVGSPSPAKSKSLQATPSTHALTPGSGAEATVQYGRSRKKDDLSRVRKILDMSPLQVPMVPNIPASVQIPTMMRQPVVMPTTPIPQTSLSGVMLPPPTVSFPSTSRLSTSPSTAQMLASSPLLSSALTSPGGTKSTMQLQISPQSSPMPSPSPGGVKTRPQFQTPALPSQIGQTASPRFTFSTQAQTRPTLTTIPTSIANMLQQQQQARLTTPIIQQQIVRPMSLPTLPQTPSVRMINAANVHATETTPSSSSAVKPTPRIVIGTSHPGAAKTATTSQTLYRKEGPKENLYIVALPPDQLKRLEGNHVVQYTHQGQMMLVSEPGKALAASQGQIVVSKPITYLPASSPLTSKLASSKSSPTATPTAQTERRNVAEILASLSGLKPVDPPASSASSSRSSSPKQADKIGSNLVIEPITSTAATTTTTPTPVVSQGVTITALKSTPTTPTDSKSAKARPLAAILGNSGTSTQKVARSSPASTPQPTVVAKKSAPPPAPSDESNKSTPPSPSPTATSTAAEPEVAETPAGSSNPSRSRKQTLDPEVLKSPLEDQDEDNKKEEGMTPVVMGGKVDYEQDILEEDLNDLEYVPYKKAKGKKGQKSAKK